LQAIDPYASLEKSKTLLAAEIALDSSFAEAYAALARIWIFSGGYGGEHSAKEVLKNAEPLLQKALKLDPNLAEAHLALADMLMFYERDLVSAGSEYQKVLQLNPSNVDITVQISDFLLARESLRKL
jgi:tetratricopeptide (TPR) repeat protein